MALDDTAKPPAKAVTKDTAMPDGVRGAWMPRYLVAKWIASAIRLEKEAASAPSSVISKRGREARQIRASEMRTCAGELDAALRVPEGQQDIALLLNKLILAASAKGYQQDRDPPLPKEDRITDADIDALERQILTAVARVPEGGPVEPRHTITLPDSVSVKMLETELAVLRPKLEACAPYLKDGETPAQCIERNRADIDALLRLLAKEKLLREGGPVEPDETRQILAECEAMIAIAHELEGGSVPPASPPWQDISTAPKDRPILGALIRDGRIWRVHEMQYNGLAFYTFAGGSLPQMTHWMPLPEAPAASQAGEP